MKLPTNIASAARLLKKFRFASRLDPMRDWLVVIVGATVLLVVSIVWNVWFFLGALAEREATGPVDTAAEVDTANVDTVRQSFIDRATEESRYRSEYRFIDPSR